MSRAIHVGHEVQAEPAVQLGRSAKKRGGAPVNSTLGIFNARRAT